MNKIAIGATYSCSTVTDDGYSAERYGNTGVDVVSSPALIGLLEDGRCDLSAIVYRLGRGLGGYPGQCRASGRSANRAQVEASVTVTSVEGKRVGFDVQARWNEVVLMRGSHQRAIVNMERFIAGLPARLI